MYNAYSCMSVSAQQSILHWWGGTWKASSHLVLFDNLTWSSTRHVVLLLMFASIRRDRFFKLNCVMKFHSTFEDPESVTWNARMYNNAGGIDLHAHPLHAPQVSNPDA